MVSVGLVGLLGAVLIGAIAVLNLLGVSGESVRRADIAAAKDAAVGLELRNLDLSGWQLGVLGDAYRDGPKALSGADAYNVQGYDKARSELDSQLKDFHGSS